MVSDEFVSSVQLKQNVKNKMTDSIYVWKCSNLFLWSHVKLTLLPVVDIGTTGPERPSIPPICNTGGHFKTVTDHQNLQSILEGASPQTQ